MRLIIYLLIALIVVISGCQNDSTQKTKPTEPVNESFIQSHNTFGFDLLQQIAESESDNVFISPTSILVALSMLYNGADGVTKDEIAEILQVDGIDAVTLNESNAALLAALDSDTDDITLKLANSLWINDAFEFQELFAEQMNDYYHALIEAIDINDEKSLHMINDWVSDATNEKIKKMIDFIPSNMVALIMNAIYLDASWTVTT